MPTVTDWIIAVLTLALVGITAYYAFVTNAIRRQSVLDAETQRGLLEEQRKQLRVQQEQLDMARTPSLHLVYLQDNHGHNLLNLSGSFVQVLEIRSQTGQLQFKVLIDGLWKQYNTVLLEPGQMIKIHYPEIFQKGIVHNVRFVYGPSGNKVWDQELSVIR